jgi:hypothetical protein
MKLLFVPELQLLTLEGGAAGIYGTGKFYA